MATEAHAKHARPGSDRRRRALIAAGVALGLLVLAVAGWYATREGGFVTGIDGYRVLDDRTLQAEYLSGACTVSEAAQVEETAAAVTVTVRIVSNPLSCTAQAIQKTVTVTLKAPLNDRAVLTLGGAPVARLS